MLLRIFVAFALLYFSVNPAFAKRVALVMGNSEYTTFSALPNPANDARLMEKALKSVGFEVTLVLDANQSEMKQAMRAFGRNLRTGVDASLFYYAGHGVQVNGENFLIPTAANIEHEDEVDGEAINVNDFLQTLESSKSLFNIIILDACRNNPLSTARSAGGGGLAPVNAPRGSYIAYSTAPGKIALDGDSGNSPYTAALANALVQPGVKLEDVFKSTREKVLLETSEQQLPWETSSITGDFYFQGTSLIGDLALAPVKVIEGSNVDEPKENIGGVSACRKNDKKTRIQSWTPSFKSNGSLTKMPPLGEGMIIYIKTSFDSGAINCGNREVDPISLEFLEGPDRELGGWLVNFPTSAVQYVQGMCHISGFFMNKDVPGMHQGFLETYFEPIEQQKIILSGNFCMKP